MAMSNLYSKISAKPVKKCTDAGAVNQTNAWFNGVFHFLNFLLVVILYFFLVLTLTWSNILLLYLKFLVSLAKYDRDPRLHTYVVAYAH